MASASETSGSAIAAAPEPCPGESMASVSEPAGEAMVPVPELRQRPPDPRLVKCAKISHLDLFDLVACEAVSMALLRNLMTGEEHLFSFHGKAICLRGKMLSSIYVFGGLS